MGSCHISGLTKAELEQKVLLRLCRFITRRCLVRLQEENTPKHAPHSPRPSSHRSDPILHSSASCPVSSALSLPDRVHVHTCAYMHGLGVAWYGRVRYGMVLYDMAWHGTVWYGMYGCNKSMYSWTSVSCMCLSVRMCVCLSVCLPACLPGVEDLSGPPVFRSNCIQLSQLMASFTADVVASS